MKKHNFIYLLSIAIIVALGIKIVGSLLVGALMIVPAAAARNLSGDLKAYSVWSIILGVSSCVLGILLFKLIGFSAAPLIILVSTSFFLFSLIFK